MSNIDVRKEKIIAPKERRLSDLYVTGREEMCIRDSSTTVRYRALRCWHITGRCHDEQTFNVIFRYLNRYTNCYITSMSTSTTRFHKPSNNHSRNYNRTIKRFR